MELLAPGFGQNQFVVVSSEAGCVYCHIITTPPFFILFFFFWSHIASLSDVGFTDMVILHWI